MRCIFCGVASDGSRSREHILPQTLGNEEHVLPPGVVCDGCNNYFAIKLEGPLLETPHFLALRHRQELPNKRGRMPIVPGLFPAARLTIGLQRTEEGIAVGPWRERDNDAFVAALQSKRGGTFWLPVDGAVDERLQARFLAKVAVEMFAAAYVRGGQPTDEIVDVPELQAIRRFARRGDTPLTWPVHRRRLYDENLRVGLVGEQIVHEFDFLVTETSEIYAVICIFGEEFAINLGGPSIEGFVAYLEREGGRSPLYRSGELEALLASSTSI